MKTSKSILLRGIFIAVVAVMGASGKIFGQTQQAVPPPSAPAQLSEADLENLVAPIALYPDPLLAVMLPASAYPLEIVQAARFVQDTNNLAQLDSQPWDDNVKAVARFPDAIKKMNDDLQWTIDLGNAFVNQSDDLMNAIQTLRAKAQAAGTLQTTPQQVVVVTNAVVERYYETQIVYVTNTIIEIQPANPQYIYVPYYNPVYVYYPPPYVYPAPFITFGAGIAMGIYISNHRCDWYYGGVYVGRNAVVVWNGRGPYHPPYYPRPPGYRPPPYRPPPGYRPPPPGYRPPGYPDNRPPGAGRPGGGGPPTTLPADNKRWQPDPNRRQNPGTPSNGNRPGQGWGSSPSTQPVPGNGAGNNRPGTPPNNSNPGNRPGNPPNNNPNPGNRPANPPGNGTIGNPPNNSNPGNNPGNRPGTMPGNGNNGNAGNMPGGRPSTQPAPGNNQPGTRPSQPANRPSQAGGSQDSAFGGVGNGSAARNSSNRGAASRGGGGRVGGGRAGGGRR